jgi:hypothetical protein
MSAADALSKRIAYAYARRSSERLPGDELFLLNVNFIVLKYSARSPATCHRQLSLARFHPHIIETEKMAAALNMVRVSASEAISAHPVVQFPKTGIELR